jgi:hypothetical protein
VFVKRKRPTGKNATTPNQAYIETKVKKRRTDYSSSNTVFSTSTFGGLSAGIAGSASSYSGSIDAGVAGTAASSNRGGGAILDDAANYLDRMFSGYDDEEDDVFQPPKKYSSGIGIIGSSNKIAFNTSRASTSTFGGGGGGGGGGAPSTSSTSGNGGGGGGAPSISSTSGNGAAGGGGGQNLVAASSAGANAGAADTLSQQELDESIRSSTSTTTTASSSSSSLSDVTPTSSAVRPPPPLTTSAQQPNPRTASLFDENQDLELQTILRGRTYGDRNHVNIALTQRPVDVTLKSQIRMNDFEYSIEYDEQGYPLRFKFIGKKKDFY